MQQGMSYTRRDGKAMGALQRKPDHRESNLMIPRQMPNYSSCPLVLFLHLCFSSLLQAELLGAGYRAWKRKRVEEPKQQAARMQWPSLTR
jgi:hypothetical protein